MKVVETTAKTIEEAIDIALVELNASREEVEIKVIKRGKSGLLGFGNEQAKVKVEKVSDVPENIQLAYEILRNFLEYLDSPMKITTKIIENGNGSAIQDRSIYEDANIFARALFEQGDLDKRDYETYCTLYESMIGYLNPPTLMIFLKRSVPKLLERIKLRGRDYEQAIPVDYLTKLNGYYNDWYESYDLGKSLIVETDDLDFLENDDHFERLVKRIHDTIDQQEMFFHY